MSITIPSQSWEPTPGQWELPSAAACGLPDDDPRVLHVAIASQRNPVTGDTTWTNTAPVPVPGDVTGAACQKCGWVFHLAVYKVADQ